MSTRNLGLLTTTAVAALALGGFAGAALAAPNPPGSEGEPAAIAAPAVPEPPEAPKAPKAPEAPPRPAMPEPKPAAKPAKPEPKPAAEPAMPEPAIMPAKPRHSAAKDGRNLEACADGRCEVVVRDGDTIKLDDKFGVKPIRIEMRGEQVTFSRKDGSSKLTTSATAGYPGGTIHWNGLTMRIHKSAEGELILKLSHPDAREKPAKSGR
ncbi:hypothetical protein [Actinomadura sp. WMMB 499]|uniref:hypothetical protein n=1 Tax=Actinomadura sp. WMMB 499 TaxID=1219491 RepID=UPI0012449DD7|nr:hypothetical protein [Actinomadura sp. WMMB 499]QFG21770.1 hypothetical protein F7P10_12125 [Actinomadura sp. WMMB 499]